MSNEKFTSGDWMVSRHSDEVSVYMGDAVNNPYEYNCSDVWSCDSYWSEEDETAIANAHLISAAPDMYRALRGIDSKRIAVNGDGTFTITLTADEVDAIADSVSKAEGANHD
ncbi:hypothetical protein PR08_gp47 [Idiomarinaceae phage Phi1M2-2]|uniref:hypothetical protein n=1 Tax=Idiomarinaceae phage Phi1M2-2 TaxID=1527515 RepID=UPI0004F8B52D|nr:hypothetical protein PR08_gp47 [Idiomarinaceae phage Phi1M2-2]AIM40804.1 hypothetical protein M22_047 [Idiomarinaceae phage Phi1M2-2]